MLKTSYSNQDEIPENLRGAYVLSGGKWIVDELDKDHPIVAKREELLTENSSQKRKITRLENEKGTLESEVLPDGHVAILKADAELVEKVKPFGTSTEIVTKLTEHKTLKEESETRKRSDHLTEVAKVLGYTPEAFVRLQGLPDFDIREKDGQKQVVAKVKENGVVTEKPATEFIESHADFAPFLPALKTSNNGIRVPGSGAGSSAPQKDMFTQIRDRAKAKQKQSETDLHPMFKQIPGRVAQTGE